MRYVLALSISLPLAGCLSPAPDLQTEVAPTALHRPEPVRAEPISSHTEVQQAVERALPYIEEHGVAWIEQHQCTSCHQVPMLIWSHHAAVQRGLEIDTAKLDEWTRWVLAESKRVGSINSDGIAHLILGRPRATSEHADEFEALSSIVADSQSDDGSWEAGGQLPQQRRPLSETNQVATAWAVLALASTEARDDVLEQGLERMETWTAVNSEDDERNEDHAGESLEWLIVRLLTAHRFDDEARTQELLHQLLSEQHPDGGWGWRLDEASDAFATGQSLYALALLDHSADHPAVQNARRYLLDSQEQDGSWQVRSTLSSEDGATPTGIYWGTGWATIGLLSTLPEDDHNPDKAIQIASAS